MRLEKLIMTNPIRDFFTETFDLLSAGQFENLVRRGGYGFYLFHKIGRYQDLGTKIFGGTGPRVMGEPPTRPPLTDILSLL